MRVTVKVTVTVGVTVTVMIGRAQPEPEAGHTVLSEAKPREPQKCRPLARDWDSRKGRPRRHAAGS